MTLPKDIPEENFWSFTLYDNQTRSMLDTPQRYPRAGSQSYPSPAAEAERRRLHDGLLQPDAARRREARQLDPDRSEKGWFAILRLYSPLEPFFNKAGGRARSSKWAKVPADARCGEDALKSDRAVLHQGRRG